MFRVEIKDGKGNLTGLHLPASDYALLDVVAQLDTEPADGPLCTIVEYDANAFLAPLLYEEQPLYELNGLARKLAEFDLIESVSFEGLVQLEINRKEGVVTLPKLIDLAYSTDSCNAEPACNDEELGQFYVENNWLPELLDVPDKVFEFLDFQKIGKNIREEEHGVFTTRGYVVQTSASKQVYATMDFRPKKPDYVFRLTLGTSDGEQLSVLKLPSEPDSIKLNLEKHGITSLDDIVLTDFDGVPLTLDFYLNEGGLDNLNSLAKAIQELEQQGQLTKFQAVLHATDCCDVQNALRITKKMDAYILIPSQHRIQDVGRDSLRCALDENTFERLLPHVNLCSYGLALLDDRNAMVTPYGILQRMDGSVIQEFSK